jgi:hypothetical protein
MVLLNLAGAKGRNPGLGLLAALEHRGVVLVGLVVADPSFWRCRVCGWGSPLGIYRGPFCARASTATRTEVLVLDKTELGYVLDLAVPCAHCGKEAFHRVAALLEKRQVICPDCGGRTDLDSEDWTTFLEALKALQPLYDKLQ